MQRTIPVTTTGRSFACGRTSGVVAVINGPPPQLTTRHSSYNINYYYDYNGKTSIRIVKTFRRVGRGYTFVWLLVYVVVASFLFFFAPPLLSLYTPVTCGWGERLLYYCSPL